MDSKNIVPRCVVRTPTIDFKVVFQNLDKNIIDPFAFNTSFQLAHGTLPVAEKLHRWGVNISPHCKQCHNCPETTDHLLLYCAKKSFMQTLKLEFTTTVL